MTDKEILRRIVAELKAQKNAQIKADTVKPLSMEHDIWLKMEKEHAGKVTGYIRLFHSNK